MNKLLKLLGAAALVAGVAPYKVSKDEATGEVKVKALLWNASYTPATEEKAKNVDVSFGLNVPGKDAEDETHIYTDDVTVSYAAEEETPEEAPAEEPAAETVEEKAEEAAAEAEKKVEKVVAAAEEAEKQAEMILAGTQTAEEEPKTEA